MANLRAGLVGIGMMGRNHARVLGSLEGVELAVVADEQQLCFGRVDVPMHGDEIRRRRHRRLVDNDEVARSQSPLGISGPAGREPFLCAEPACDVAGAQSCASKDVGRDLARGEPELPTLRLVAPQRGVLPSLR